MHGTVSEDHACRQRQWKKTRSWFKDQVLIQWPGPDSTHDRRPASPTFRDRNLGFPQEFNSWSWMWHVSVIKSCSKTAFICTRNAFAVYTSCSICSLVTSGHVVFELAEAGQGGQRRRARIGTLPLTWMCALYATLPINLPLTLWFYVPGDLTETQRVECVVQRGYIIP